MTEDWNRTNQGETYENINLSFTASPAFVTNRSAFAVMFPIRNVFETIRMYVLIVLFACGLPLNVYMNLNITNLMMLTIYTTSDIAWLVTVDWRAGEAMCKAVKFFVIFCMSINSYIIVCLSVYCFICHCMNKHPCILYCFAWLLALANALPEVANWTLLRPSKITNWEQCTLMWLVLRYRRVLLHESPSRVEYMSINVYNIYLGIVVFWIPVLLILLFYLSSLCTKCGNRYRSLIQLEKPSEISFYPCRYDVDDRSVTIASIPSRSYAKHCAMTKIKRKTFNTSRLLILTYLLCWLPYNAFAMWTSSHYSSYENWHSFVTSFLSCLLILNSIINPIIYLRWKRLSR
ncbi:unnamed protein product [Soboliphyme baturini]|uniref:G_PROTEIN_RECEP_F1_2 domain-containing protein n=1 Tax=Soboliphyme baturini TaxID=241478 RepID=A0A183IVF9_9BILA|nr:unnamed protein product [Soboliphyme baturini]